MYNTSEASLADRLQSLEDVAAIKDLQYDFWRYMDLKQPEEFRNIFAAGDIHVEGANHPILRDREAFIDHVKENSLSPAWQGNHLGMSPKIQLTGADTAKGTWRVLMIGYNFDHRIIIRITGEHMFEYARTAEGWRITSMRSQQQSFFMESVAQTGELTAANFGPVKAAA